MLDKKGSSVPYKPLGRRLKALRVSLNETLAEAAGSVEIDVRELASFELGQSRPTEDLLILLLSHFGVKDDEAVKLWSLAGYQMGRVQSAQMASETPPAESIVSDSPQIMFTDVVDVIVNNYGVVMHFMQNNGKGSPSTVAKVGMSREHAKSVLQILQVTLAQTEKPKQIADSTPESI